MSDHVSESFDLAGYPLLTNIMAPVGLIEVYPHPALVELAWRLNSTTVQGLEG
jgi:predicted RNase H-like nuclease